MTPIVLKKNSTEVYSSSRCLRRDLECLMMVCEGLCFVVVSGELPKVAVDIVGITALGFELNGHVLDAEVRRNPVLDQL